VTVAQHKVASISYFHIELERHDILLAEGLPAESYLETGSRSAFENGGAIVQMAPDFALRTWDGDACAPLVVDGPELDRARALLARRVKAMMAGAGKQQRSPSRRRPPKTVSSG